jgi:hypothetical protein
VRQKHYDEIIDFLKNWVEEEGLCRFCWAGRVCRWSRHGRQECDGYWCSHEMDCFHLWISAFDRGIRFRLGYESTDSYPWENKGEEADDCAEAIMYSPIINPELKNIAAEIRELRNKRQRIMQKIDKYPNELKSIEKKIAQLQKQLETQIIQNQNKTTN